MSRPPGLRGVLMLAVLVAPLFVLLMLPSPAEAHASVVSTAPANGAELDTAPTAVRVVFDEPVTLASRTDSASVVDADGRRVDTGRGRLESDRHALVIAVRAGLARGTYIASWSVVSADTHPTGGSIQFGYGSPAVAISAPTARRPNAGWELAVGASKALVYLGLTAALGLLPAALLLGVDDRERRLLRRVALWGAAVVAAGSVAQLVVQHLWQSSATPGGTSLLRFAESSYATAVYTRLGLLALAVVVLPPAAAGRARWSASGLLALAVLGSVVRNGHGGSAVWWQFVSTLLHVAAVTAWLGGLAALGWLVLRRRLSAERLRRLPWWSVYAATAVTVLVLSGLLQAIVEVRYPGALLTTTYGYVLLVKVLLVAVAIALGFSGFRWIRRQTTSAGPVDADGRPAPGQTAALRGRVRREATIGAVVVVLSGVLSSITPAEAAFAPTATVHTAIGPYAVTVGVAPTRRGPQSFRVAVVGRADATPLPRSLLLDLRQVDGPVRALRVSFPYRLPGALRPGAPTPITFSSTSVSVPASGVWTGTLTVVADRTEQYTADFDYLVR